MLYLGLDSSTQSLTAVVLEVEGDRRRVVFESSLNFDTELPRYGTRHGVLPSPDPAVAVSSPVMWAEALDVMMTRVSGSGLDISRLAAIAGSAQQHGSVYLREGAAERLADMDPGKSLALQVEEILSRRVAPIWMDSSTTAECVEIAAKVGGNDVLARHTGSRAFERFTGPQIRKFYKQEPSAYSSTGRIHLVSSFLASLLAGQHAPIDTGDASGMNLMDLATFDWWRDALDATAPGARRPAASHRARLGGRRATVALLAGAARPSTGEGHRVVGRQPVQPHRNGPRARGTRCDLARDERHDLRSDARAAGRPHRHGPRVRRADRRLHGHHGFQERLARAGTDPRRVRPDVVRLLARAHHGSAGERESHPAPVVRAGDHARRADAGDPSIRASAQTTFRGTFGRSSRRSRWRSRCTRAGWA